MTFKNVHSFLDRNINRFPIKNVERSFAKNYSRSVNKNSIPADYQSVQTRMFSNGLFYDTISDSEVVHHGVGVIIVSLKRKSKVYKVL